MATKDMFTEKRVCFDMKAKTKMEALDELIDVLVKDGVINDSKVFKEAVLKREEEFSTGIGMGIAIPHGKSNSVNKASIAFGKSKDGVDYQSMDEKPAHLFFLIAVPEEANDTHLRALSEISRKLMHSDIRESLMNCTSFDQFIKVFE
ncbi:PTS sugar transporter subunit IIA [Clostridium folliculivorans]|uniref:PTS fructose transporter subunit IIA n=1 Tax=Clostridium folliculivorans TaxID=2886038 RepID=A0A9W6DDM8_9CLOT|nr:PTS sugar transporter subunit IIA [Clostridium folliculivorans]GKU27856.1 PTS fructose transporter subunit IIA [Clostridium folliculivorans]GKU32603.1 PTS fructose transporter subunit IIA [Clostridium folliculivorans]